MTTLLLVVGSLLAAGSGLFFFRIRSPAGAPLTLPKMFVTSGAAFVAGTGALIAVLLGVGAQDQADDEAGEEEGQGADDRIDDEPDHVALARDRDHRAQRPGPPR